MLRHVSSSLADCMGLDVSDEYRCPQERRDRACRGNRSWVCYNTCLPEAGCVHHRGLEQPESLDLELLVDLQQMIHTALCRSPATCHGSHQAACCSQVRTARRPSHPGL